MMVPVNVLDDRFDLLAQILGAQSVLYHSHGRFLAPCEQVREKIGEHL